MSISSVVKTGESGLHVSLHPLPILNISEHLTRTSLQLRDPNVRVIGGLLGTQQGREVEIMNTFEIVVGDEGVDHAYFVTRKEQFKQVFPSFDFLGWYSVGETPTEDDVKLHQQFFEYNETPLFLLFQRTPSPTSASLPLSIYESIIEIIDNEPKVLFVGVGYEIETGEAERVAVESVGNAGGGGKGGLIASLQTQRNALSMLHSRIMVILTYLEAIQKGTARVDQETLRMISSLVTSLGGNGSGLEELEEEGLMEYNDVLLGTYLASLMKGLESSNQLLDKQLLLFSASNNNNNGGGSHGGNFNAFGVGGRDRGNRRGNKAAGAGGDWGFGS